MPRLKAILTAVGLLLLATMAAAQGYRIESNRLVVEEGDWSGWTLPTGTVDTTGGVLRPRRIRERFNAVEDASSFVDSDEVSGGIRSAGSNEANAIAVIDGDETTYWEPDTSLPLSSWWVEIDLGRVVWADQIVVKFAGADQGDPFLQFNVLTANGLVAFSQSKTLRYITAARTEGLNKTERVFEFDLKPSQETAGLFAGDVFRFVQILVTASDLGRGQLVSDEGAWSALPKEDRGDIVHFLQESSGVIREIAADQYDLLETERQGPIQYYQRERPRLAEVEVWTHGDNISLGSLDRGGDIGSTTNNGTEGFAVDGDYRTVWNEQVGVSGGVTVDVPFDRELVFDLGAWFWINRMAFSFDRENIAHGFTGAFPNYVLELSEGQRNPDGSLAYVFVGERETNDKDFGRFGGLFPHIFYEQNEFPLTKARFFKVDYKVLEIAHSWANSGIRELQLYGRGYLPEVTIHSPLIELDRTPQILANIDWQAETPSGTQVKFRTRTGYELKQVIHYYRSTGLEVTEAKYRKLLSFQRGDTLVTTIPGEDWSNWSKYYAEPGGAITSPSPRRYLLLEASIVSDDPDQFALLRNMEISLDQPLASQVIGEISPREVTSRGTLDTLTVYLKPSFPLGSTGFDQLLIETTPGLGAELIDVQVGTEDQLTAGTAHRFEANELQLMPGSNDSLWVQMPRLLNSNQDLVAMRFSAALYLASNTFQASVARGTGDELIWQRVDAGEATDLATGSGLTVFTPFGGSVVGNVDVLSNPFTPNGDGVNDEVVMVFPVFKVQGSKDLIMEVFSLDGRLVRRVEQMAAFAAGEQRISWDGRNASGHLAPPGLYVCRVGIEVDKEGSEPMVARLVSSVY